MQQWQTAVECAMQLCQTCIYFAMAMMLVIAIRMRSAKHAKKFLLFLVMYLYLLSVVFGVSVEMAITGQVARATETGLKPELIYAENITKISKYQLLSLAAATCLYGLTAPPLFRKRAGQ